jgi:hypothetical protein
MSSKKEQDRGGAGGERDHHRHRRRDLAENDGKRGLPPSSATPPTFLTIESRSTGNILRNILLGTSQQDRRRDHHEDGAPRRLLVVAAGLGRTSTSSLTAAMQLLGAGESYRTYQFADGVQGVAGHVDLWHRYLAITPAAPCGERQ